VDVSAFAVVWMALWAWIIADPDVPDGSGRDIGVG
jgi:hypothetical protein